MSCGWVRFGPSFGALLGSGDPEADARTPVDGSEVMAGMGA